MTGRRVRAYRAAWRTGVWQGALIGALLVVLAVEAARRLT